MRSVRGMTIIEITAAAAVLGVLLAGAVQAMRVLDAQQRAATRRSVALEAGQSLLEQLANAPFDQLTPADARQLELPTAVQPHLPGATATAAIAEVLEPVPAKRVSLTLAWNGPNGQLARPIRLTTWVYPND